MLFPLRVALAVIIAALVTDKCHDSAGDNYHDDYDDNPNISSATLSTVQTRKFWSGEIRVGATRSTGRSTVRAIFAPTWRNTTHITHGCLLAAEARNINVPVATRMHSTIFKKHISGVAGLTTRSTTNVQSRCRAVDFDAVTSFAGEAPCRRPRCCRALCSHTGDAVRADAFRYHFANSSSILNWSTGCVP